MLKIWGRTTSSNVQKVLWCCAELGIEYERVDLGGPFGGNRYPEYLAMNPNGRVPTIKDGDSGLVGIQHDLPLSRRERALASACIRPHPPRARMSSVGWIGSSPLRGRQWRLCSAC